MGVGGGLKCLIDQCKECATVDEAEDILHIGSEFHFNLGIPIIQVQKFDPELLSKRFVFHFSKNRFFHLIVHHLPFEWSGLP